MFGEKKKKKVPRSTLHSIYLLFDAFSIYIHKKKKKNIKERKIENRKEKENVRKSHSINCQCIVHNI